MAKLLMVTTIEGDKRIYNIDTIEKILRTSSEDDQRQSKIIFKDGGASISVIEDLETILYRANN